MPRPFLKWAGGKRQLLPELLKRVDQAEPFLNYHEPFVGGGALFFELARRNRLRRDAHLTDTNPNLIDAYLGVQNDVSSVIELLRRHEALHGEDYFYEVRAEVPESRPERAARIIYLNKTCYNGLFRENSRGQFNVPFGRYKRPNICDEANLRAVSEALDGAVIEVRRFESVLEKAQRGDFVYFDPPYVPLSATSSFTAYSKEKFGETEQRQLAEVYASLAERGVKVLLSNSGTELVDQLYSGFHVDRVLASRAVNSRADRRGKIEEALVRSFDGRELPVRLHRAQASASRATLS